MTGLNAAITHEAAAVEPARAIADPSLIDSGAYDPAVMIDQLPVLELPLSSLEPGFFLRRCGTDPAHIRMLADAAGSCELPPIVVQKNNSRIVDGMHRVEAARLRGQKSIRAHVIKCTDEDAFILAVKTNTLHGLPLSRADRMAGAKCILAWHADWSDRAVGVATGLSARTIADLRRRSTGGTHQPNRRLGRDGKLRPLTGAEGRRRAADYIAARPDASLREIAREANVSLGTVQDVRARMRRGADPMLVARGGSYPEQGAHSPAPGMPAGWPLPKDAMSSRDVKLRAHQATWSAISAKLASDPSLKYTESGRMFIRWMTLQATQAPEWTEFIEAVPSRWLRDIGLIAENIGEQWREFAEQLRIRQSSST
jgi:ParB-like chromosome segregation protein Spo0J